MSIRVLIADDEPVICQGLAAILTPEPDITVVGQARDGAEAVSAVREHQPDVVLMDVRMPRVDGIEATRVITTRWPATARVLVLTTFSDDDYVIGALRCGASGFLLKRASAEELTGAIRTVRAGESLLFPTALRHLFQGSTTPQRARADFDRLTPREAQTLLLVAEGLSNAEIAAQLHVGVETVRSHVASILAKLGVRDRTQAVVRAYRDRFIAL